MIHTVVSQQPGCVVDPSYVMKCSVSGRSARNEMSLTGVESPKKKHKYSFFLLSLDPKLNKIRFGSGLIIMGLSTPCFTSLIRSLSKLTLRLLANNGALLLKSPELVLWWHCQTREESGENLIKSL